MEPSANVTDNKPRETHWRSYSKSLIVELKEKLEDRRARTLALLAENNDLTAFRDIDTESDGLDDTSTNLTNDHDSYVRHNDLPHGQMFEPHYLSETSSLSGSELYYELENSKEYEVVQSPDARRRVVEQQCGTCSSTATSVSSVSLSSDESKSEGSGETRKEAWVENTIKSEHDRDPRPSRSATFVVDQGFDMQALSDAMARSQVSVIQASERECELKSAHKNVAVESSSDLIRICMLKCPLGSRHISAERIRQTKSETLLLLYSDENAEAPSGHPLCSKSYDCLQSEIQLCDFLTCVGEDKKALCLYDIHHKDMDGARHKYKESRQQNVEEAKEIRERERLDEMKELPTESDQQNIVNNHEKGEGDSAIKANRYENMDKLGSDETILCTENYLHQLDDQEDMVSFPQKSECDHDHKYVSTGKTDVDDYYQTKKREDISDITFSNHKRIIEDILNILENNEEFYKVVDKNVISNLEDNFSDSGVFKTEYQNISHNSGYTNTLKQSSHKRQLQDAKAENVSSSSRMKSGECDNEETQLLHACLEKAKLASTLHSSVRTMRNRADNLAAKKAYEKAVSDFEQLMSVYYDGHVSGQDGIGAYDGDLKSNNFPEKSPTVEKSDFSETRKALRRSSTFVVEEKSDVKPPVSKLKRSNTNFTKKSKLVWSKKEIGAKAGDDLAKDAAPLDADDAQQMPHSSPTFHVITEENVDVRETSEILPDKDPCETYSGEDSKRKEYDVPWPAHKKIPRSTLDFTDFYSDSSDSATEAAGTKDLRYSSSVLTKMLGLDSTEEGKPDKEINKSEDTGRDKLDSDARNKKSTLEAVKTDYHNTIGMDDKPKETLVESVAELISMRNEKGISKSLLVQTGNSSTGQVCRNDNQSEENSLNQILEKGLAEDEENEPAYESDFDSDTSPHPGQSLQAVCSGENITTITKASDVNAHEDVPGLCLLNTRETVNPNPVSAEQHSPSLSKKQQDETELLSNLKDVEKLSGTNGGRIDTIDTYKAREDPEYVRHAMTTELQATEGNEQRVSGKSLSVFPTDNDNIVDQPSIISPERRKRKEWSITPFEPLSLTSTSPPRQYLGKFVPKSDWSSSDDDAVDDLQRDVSPSHFLKQRQKEDVDGKLLQLSQYAQRNRKSRSPLRLKISDKLASASSMGRQANIPTVSDLTDIFSIAQVSPTGYPESLSIPQSRSVQSPLADEYDLTVDKSPSQLLHVRISQENETVSRSCLGEIQEVVNVPTNNLKDSNSVPAVTSPKKLSKEDDPGASECISSGSTTSGEYTFPVLEGNVLAVKSDTGLNKQTMVPVNVADSPRSYCLHEAGKPETTFIEKAIDIAYSTAEKDGDFENKESAKEFYLFSDEDAMDECQEERVNERLSVEFDNAQELLTPKTYLQTAAMENLVRQISADEAPCVTKCSEPALFFSLDEPQVSVLQHSSDENPPELTSCQTAIPQTSPIPLREECKRILSSLSNVPMKDEEDHIKRFDQNTEAFYAVPDELDCANPCGTNEIVSHQCCNDRHGAINPLNTTENEIVAVRAANIDTDVMGLKLNIDIDVSQINKRDEDLKANSGNEDKWHFIADVNDFYKCSETHRTEKSNTRHLNKVVNTDKQLLEPHLPEKHYEGDRQQTDGPSEEFIFYGLNECHFPSASVCEDKNARERQRRVSPICYGNQVLRETLDSPLKRQSQYSNSDLKANIFSSPTCPYHHYQGQTQLQPPQQPLLQQHAQRFYGQHNMAHSWHCQMANESVFDGCQNCRSSGIPLDLSCGFYHQLGCLQHNVQTHMAPNAMVHGNQEMQRHSKASQTDWQQCSDQKIYNPDRTTKSTETHYEMDEPQETPVAKCLEPIFSKVGTICEAIEEIKCTIGSCNDKNKAVCERFGTFEDRMTTLLANQGQQLQMSKVDTDTKLEKFAQVFDPTYPERLAQNVKGALVMEMTDIFKQNLQKVIPALQTTVTSETEQLRQHFQSSLTNIQESLRGQSKEINERISCIEAIRSSLEASKAQLGSRGMDCETMKMRIVELTSQRDAEKVFHKITRESLRALERDHDRLRQEYIRATYRREKHGGESSRRRIFQILSEAEETHLANDRYSSLLKSENLSPRHSNNIRRHKDSQRESSDKVYAECRHHGDGRINQRTLDDRKVVPILKRNVDNVEHQVDTEISSEKHTDTSRNNANNAMYTKSTSQIKRDGFSATETNVSMPTNESSLPWCQLTSSSGAGKLYKPRLNSADREERLFQLDSKVQSQLTYLKHKTDHRQAPRTYGKSNYEEVKQTITENIKNNANLDCDSGLSMKLSNTDHEKIPHFPEKSDFMGSVFAPGRQCGQSGSSETLTGDSIEGKRRDLNLSPKSTDNSLQRHDSNTSVALSDKCF